MHNFVLAVTTIYELRQPYISHPKKYSFENKSNNNNGDDSNNEKMGMNLDKK